MTLAKTVSRATLHTSLGDILVELFPNHAPKTVANFVELATGAKEWTNPNTGEKTNANLYDGTIFHRVIDGFMIQGGDPLGKGTGGPGYRFADEFHGELTFDRPYILAMANSGPQYPNSNGSQFFLVYEDSPALGPSYSVWGKITKGLDVLKFIASKGVDDPSGIGKPRIKVAIEAAIVR